MYLKHTLGRAFALASLTMGGALLQGCDSGSTGVTGGENFADETFVADDATAGRIELEVLENPITVADTSGFTVSVFDKDNRPVRHAQVVCDSEREIAIIEPTTGLELTSANGHMSGIIGCNAPGSFQLACRLASGGNRRKFVDIRCVGDIPQGFSGFPGAAGGGLGGGVLPPSAGGPGEPPDDGEITGIRIVAITAENARGEDSTQIDTDFRTCNTETADTADDFPEPFTDDHVKLTVVNNSTAVVRFTRLAYVIEDISGTQDAESVELDLTAEVEANPGEQVTIRSLFLDAVGGGKRTPVEGNVISGEQGFNNVRFTLIGTTTEGQESREIEIDAATAFSFDAFNFCES